MDCAEVDRAILVPPSWEGDRNDLVIDAATSYPDRFAAMGRIALTHPDPDALAGWRNQPGMLGARVTFSIGQQCKWLADGTSDWFFEAAEAADVPVMIYAPGLLLELADKLTRHPRLRVIVDHLGLPASARDDAIGPELELLSRLAAFPTVAVKASALPYHVSEAYPFPSLHAHLRHVVSIFGPRRVFWGTDLTRLPCTYREARSWAEVALADLGAEDVAWVMGRGVAAWLDWPPRRQTGSSPTSAAPSVH
jgi:predicted TIM-barrel fold metal-dependent hydrolase